MSKNSGVVALNSNEATITMATITIKALKVNNRQLTQAVFRQLPERSLIEESKPELIGLPWGWVNYRSADMGEGRQFVAQFGTTLARCPVRLRRSSTFWPSDSAPDPYLALARYYKKLCIKEILLSALYGTLPADAVRNSSVGIEARGGFPAFSFEFHSHIHYDIIDIVQQIYFPTTRYRDVPGTYKRDTVPPDEVREDARGRLRDHLLKRGFDPAITPARRLAELDRIADLASAYCRRWDDLINTLESVEQLFIAT